MRVLDGDVRARIVQNARAILDARRGFFIPRQAGPRANLKASRISCCVAPVAINARTIRSSDTEGSPASIFETWDRLDPIRCARSILEGPCFWRDLLRASMSESLTSTRIASWSPRPRKSFAPGVFRSTLSYSPAAKRAPQHEAPRPALDTRLPRTRERCRRCIRWRCVDCVDGRAEQPSRHRRRKSM